MSQLHPDLEAVCNPWGAPRFFPPGQHPATHRWREHRWQLAALPASPLRDEMIEYIDEKLAMFEEGESEAKQRELRRFDERRDRFEDGWT